VPLQQFLLVREHVLALMTSERFAGTLPIVPSATLAPSDAARIYLVKRTPPCETPARPGDPPSLAPPAAGPGIAV